MRSRNLTEVLVVEDNPGDASLVREILGEAKTLTHVRHVEDGSEALKYLRREDSYREMPVPNLIFLDLSLPGTDGREVLEEIKVNPALKAVPVVVITTSRTTMDISRCYDRHANCFVTKPETPEELADVVRRIARFWLEVVTLPRY